MDDLDDFFSQPTGATSNPSSFHKVYKDRSPSLSSSSEEETPLPRVKRDDSSTPSSVDKKDEGQGHQEQRKEKETKKSPKRHTPDSLALANERPDRKSVHQIVVSVDSDSDSERSGDDEKTNDYGSKGRTLTKKKKAPPSPRSPRSPPSSSPRIRLTSALPAPPPQQRQKSGRRSRLMQRSPRTNGGGKSHSSSDWNSENSDADSWEVSVPSVCSVEVKKKTKRKSTSSSKRSVSPEDMTDVSPLTSGRPSPRAASKSKNSSVSFALPKEDRLQMDLLMRAILEMDREERKQLMDYSAQSLWQKENHGGSSTQSRNFSFPSDRTRAIDQENQRLLGKLLGPGQRRHLAQAAERKEVRPTRMTSAAVNRFKEHRRIEQENMALLRRLETIKPTRGITRDEQMRDYVRTGVQPPPPPAPPKSRTRSQADAASSLGSRTTSLFSVRSVAASESSGKRSRPSSGKEVRTRPKTGRRTAWTFD